MPHTYPFPRPAVTVDCVVFRVDQETLEVLLIKRGGEPFKGAWALPGGFVDVDEDLVVAARRELLEETGLDVPYLEQLYTFGVPGRDPRGHTVTVAYFALLAPGAPPIEAASDAAEAAWFAVRRLPSLAFDHEEVIACAIDRLQGKITYEPIGFELLSDKFTLSQLQRLYEIVLERPLDKRNFRKKILSMELLNDAGETQKDVPHRAARLYSFDLERYQRLAAAGFTFRLCEKPVPTSD